MERRYSKRRLQRRERLTTALLVKLSFYAVSIVLIASALTFTITYKNAYTQVIDVLQQDLAPTLAQNQAFFERVEGYADVMANGFLTRYKLRLNNREALNQFNDWYEETSPGVVRLGADFAQGIVADSTKFEYLSGFLGPRQPPITDELKQRVIASQYTLNALAPAWQTEVANSHFSMPENVLILFSTSSPWGLLADKDLVITDYSVVQSTLKSENPQREPNWTGLYYDISAGVWTITYQRPVDYNDRHLVNASFDVNLSHLLSSLTQRKRARSEHMVLKQNGDLIAASNLTTDEMTEASVLNSKTYDEPFYQAVRAFVGSQPIKAASLITETAVDGQLIIVHKMPGPEWLHVTLYPLSEIREQALKLPIQLVMAGVVLVFLILLITYWLIRNEVSKPLQEVATVASMMGRRDYADALSHRAENISARGEVKQALDAFKMMAQRFIESQSELEKQVESRTAELGEANKKLDALAHIDGLTGLLNRRAFDRDLTATLLKPENHYLMLADIDDFKPYNDNYGHEAGDQALRAIAQCLRDNAAVSIYRYGGEEIAAIIDADEPDDVRKLLEHLRISVNELDIKHVYGTNDSSLLSISLGAAAIVPGDTPEDVIRRADRQLYRAKRAGRNCCFVE